MNALHENHYDWRWRLNHYYKIRDKNNRLVTFTENGIQKQLNSNRKKRRMILKYRQGGVTTNETLKQLDYVIWRDNVTACLLAHKKQDVQKIFRIPKLSYRKLDPFIKPKLDRGGGSKNEMYFPELNSRYYCDIESRGDTINYLHISEAAFADPDRVRATLEAVPPWGIVTYESTPNGMGNGFYRQWITPSNRVEKLFFPWFFHEEYTLDAHAVGELTPEETEFCIKAKARYGVIITKGQIAFRRAKIEDLADLFLQEYPEDDVSCFLASGSAPFDLVLIHDMLKNSPDPIVDKGYLKIWKPYDQTRLYAIGADVAEGVRSDYSVATVFDVRTREEVAQLRSNTWKPSEFAHQIAELALSYRHGDRPYPLVGVEMNNHGHAVLQKLQDKEINYPNLYEYAEGRVGWRTDRVTRPIMVDTFIEGVENLTIKLNSRETLGECLTLVDNNGKIEAEDGEHDDTIMANAIGVQMCIESSKFEIYDDISNRILI